MPQPWTREDDQTLTRLHADGSTLRGAAKTMGRPLATTQQNANRLGLQWDRSQTRNATVAKQADNRARRAALEALLLENAEHLARQVRQPHEYIEHGGKDFIEVRWQQDEPTPTDKLKLMQAAGIGIDRSLRIAEFDADNGAEAVKSMLGGIASALGIGKP